MKWILCVALAAALTGCAEAPAPRQQAVVVVPALTDATLVIISAHGQSTARLTRLLDDGHRVVSVTASDAGFCVVLEK